MFGQFAIFYYLCNHRSYKTLVCVSPFTLRSRILPFDATIRCRDLVACTNYESAVINEVDLSYEGFSVTVDLCVRADAFPLRACEWVLVAGLGGILLATSGESKEHNSEEHEDVL